MDLSFWPTPTKLITPVGDFVADNDTVVVIVGFVADSVGIVIAVVVATIVGIFFGCN